MGDSFTNILLVSLISLVAWLGKALYDKLDEIIKNQSAIMQANERSRTEIEMLKHNQVDHEARIRILENKM